MLLEILSFRSASTLRHRASDLMIGGRYQLRVILAQVTDSSIYRAFPTAVLDWTVYIALGTASDVADMLVNTPRNVNLGGDQPSGYNHFVRLFATASDLDLADGRDGQRYGFFKSA